MVAAWRLNRQAGVSLGCRSVPRRKMQPSYDHLASRSSSSTTSPLHLDIDSLAIPDMSDPKGIHVLVVSPPTAISHISTHPPSLSNSPDWRRRRWCSPRPRPAQGWNLLHHLRQGRACAVSRSGLGNYHPLGSPGSLRPPPRALAPAHQSLPNRPLHRWPARMRHDSSGRFYRCGPVPYAARSEAAPSPSGALPRRNG